MSVWAKKIHFNLWILKSRDKTKSNTVIHSGAVALVHDFITDEGGWALENISLHIMKSWASLKDNGSQLNLNFPTGLKWIFDVAWVKRNCRDGDVTPRGSGMHSEFSLYSCTAICQTEHRTAWVYTSARVCVCVRDRRTYLYCQNHSYLLADTGLWRERMCGGVITYTSTLSGCLQSHMQLADTGR